MKKVFLTLAFLLTTVVASAQIYVGGGIGLKYNKPNEGDATTSVCIKPEVGYQLNDKITVGAVLGADWVQDASTTIKVEPFVRYTFLRMGNFAVFADGAVGFGMIKPEEGDNVTTWNVAVRPGVEYAINNKWSIAAHAGEIGYFDVDGENSIDVNLGNAVSIGVYYKF